MANTKAERRLARLLDQAEACGLCALPDTRADAEALRRRAASGALISPVRGIYARVEYWNNLKPDQRARHMMGALAKKHPGWVFSHFSAALLHGLEVPYSLLNRIDVMARAGSDVRGSRVLRVRKPAKDVAGRTRTIDGVRVTELALTIADCLRSLSFAYGLVLADSFMRMTGMPRDVLFELLEREAAGRRGAQRARIIAAHADGRAESGGESLARAAMIEQGFMVPDLQVEFPDAVQPSRSYRADNFWSLEDGGGIIGECDGLEKYMDEKMLGSLTTAQAMARERQRESRLTMLGYPVVRYGYHEASHPHLLRKLLCAAGVPRDDNAAEAWRRGWRAAQPRKNRAPAAHTEALATPAGGEAKAADGRKATDGRKDADERGADRLVVPNIRFTQERIAEAGVALYRFSPVPVAAVAGKAAA